jgi:hypothetical protein
MRRSDVLGLLQARSFASTGGMVWRFRSDYARNSGLEFVWKAQGKPDC